MMFVSGLTTRTNNGNMEANAQEVNSRPVYMIPPTRDQMKRKMILSYGKKPPNERDNQGWDSVSINQQE